MNVCEAYRDMVMVTSKRFFSGFFLDFFLVNMTQLPVFRDYYFFLLLFSHAFFVCSFFYKYHFIASIFSWQ